MRRRYPAVEFVIEGLASARAVNGGRIAVPGKAGVGGHGGWRVGELAGLRIDAGRRVEHNEPVVRELFPAPDAQAGLLQVVRRNEELRVIAVPVHQRFAFVVVAVYRHAMADPAHADVIRAVQGDAVPGQRAIGGEELLGARTGRWAGLSSRSRRSQLVGPDRRDPLRVAGPEAMASRVLRSCRTHDDKREENTPRDYTHCDFSRESGVPCTGRIESIAGGNVRQRSLTFHSRGSAEPRSRIVETVCSAVPRRANASSLAAVARRVLTGFVCRKWPLGPLRTRRKIHDCILQRDLVHVSLGRSLGICRFPPVATTHHLERRQRIGQTFRP